MAVEVGQEAPDFTLKNPDNEDVTLSSFRGQKNVVVVFFPAAFSGVCSKQFTEIGASEARYAGEDAQVLGISVDNASSLGAFARDLGLTDTVLLSDFHPKGKVAKDYGAWFEPGGLATRASFVIDRDGIVRYRQVSESPGDWVDQEPYFAEGFAACNA